MRAMSAKQLAAMAGENIEPTTWEIWRVFLPGGETFEVSGQVAAERWVCRCGGRCEFTGKYEVPSIT